AAALRLRADDRGSLGHCRRHERRLTIEPRRRSSTIRCARHLPPRELNPERGHGFGKQPAAARPCLACGTTALGRSRNTAGDRRWILVAERQELPVGYLLGDRRVVGLHVHSRAAQELLLVGASNDGPALADDDPLHAEYRTAMPD